jgi:hypothetical protein
MGDARMSRETRSVLRDLWEACIEAETAALRCNADVGETKRFFAALDRKFEGR